MKAPEAKAVIAVMLTAGYIALTLYSLKNWHEAVSVGLVVGFGAFATDFIRGYARSNNGRDPKEPPNA